MVRLVDLEEGAGQSYLVFSICPTRMQVAICKPGKELTNPGSARGLVS